MKNLIFKCLSIFLLNELCFAQDTLETVVVTDDVSQMGARSDPAQIRSAEMVNPKALTKVHQNTFSEAIDSEKGVDSLVSCAFCGSKRVTINGMKGEHTSLLIDDLPLHSSISNFYGVDAISLQLLESLEVYRGAGSLAGAPEALGGVLSLKLKEPFKDEAKLGFGGSDLGGLKAFTHLEQRVHPSHAVLVGAEWSQAASEDQDQNGVSEVPWQETGHLYLKTDHQIGKSQLQFRIGQSQMDAIGGNPEKEGKSESTMVPEQGDFRDGDTRKKYIGDPLKITDDIQLRRDEKVLKYVYSASDELQFQISAAEALQRQRSIYSHGYDFLTNDLLRVFQAQILSVQGENQYLKFGLQVRDQDFNSSSEQLYETLGLREDDSKSFNVGSFFESEQALSQSSSLQWGIRLDLYQTIWTDLDSEFSQTAASPRLAFKHQHSANYLSRFAVGRGQRVPLSLFESQHGTNEHGFTVEISSLEIADSFSYQGLWQAETSFWEVNLQSTHLQNMAFAEEPLIANDPLIFTNSDEDYWISILDFSFGEQLNPSWNYEVVSEFFFYPQGYKEKLPTASIERRIQVRSEYQLKNWKLQGALAITLERNLSDYGYLRNYNRLTGTFPDPEVGQDLKRQSAPTFATLDIAAERSLNQNWKLIFSVANLTNYTQTSAGDSPLAWERHGDHFHLDNRHLWGPLKGRQFFAQFEGTF